MAPNFLLDSDQILAVLSLSKNATAIYVSPDIIIQSANDAMLAFWGKDSSIIGMPLEEGVPELKGQPFKKMLQKVLETGITDAGIIPGTTVINGKPQTAYYDFEYRAIKNADGVPYCILHTATDVSERELNRIALMKAREAEAMQTRALKENEKNLRLIILQAPVSIAIFKGPEYIVEIVNSRALELWGRKAAEVHNLPIMEAMPELESQGVRELLDGVYKTGKPFLATELPVKLLRQGEMYTAYINFVYEPLYNADGVINGLITIGTEVTEQVLVRKSIENSERELKNSEQKLDQIISQLPAPIVVLSGPDQVIETTNKALLSFWNKTKNEVLGKPMLEVFPELAAQPFPAQWKHVFDTGEIITNREMPVTFNTKDGGKRLFYVDYYYQPLNDINGKRTGVLATVIDVTDKVDSRKVIEENAAELFAINKELASANEEMAATNEELTETQNYLQKTIAELAISESRFRSFVEQAPVAIAVFKTRRLNIELVNDNMLEIWGKTNEIIDKPLAVAMPELIGQPFLQILDDVFTSGKVFYGSENKAFVIRNGEVTEGYFNFICQPILNESGAITSILQVVTEVTDQVTIRLELQKAEEMANLAVEAAKLGSWYINPATKALKYNATLAKLFGWEGDEEMTYHQAIAQVTDEYRDKIMQAIEHAISGGGDYDITYTQRRFNDGEIIWLRSLGKIGQDENGNYTIFSGFVMDITEQKLDEIRKNDFIGMVSHELKTPLTSLTAIVQVLNSKLKMSEDSFIAGAMDKANIQVKKMSAMINGFLNISRLESGKMQISKQNFDLKGLLEEAIDEAKITLTNHIINLVQCDLVTINADRDKIGSVISNFLSNAVKYSPKRELIEVRCLVIGDNVQVSVKDEGMGIKEKDRKRLFERYYRVETNHTRHISGFGIGLYLSAEIVGRHNGQIWVESESGKGSTFYFSLPLAK